MFFINQLIQQFQNTLFSYQQEMGPGSHDFDAERLAQESAQREAEDPISEEDRLAEVDALATETTAEMRDRMGDMRDEQGRIARAEATSAIADVDAGGSGNPESILTIVPANDGERLAAEAAIIAAGGDISDEAAVNAAIVAQRGENPGVIRELSVEEQTVVRDGLLADFANQVDIDPVTLALLYDFNSENNPDFDPESIGHDVESFANNMERLRILTERIEGLEMPTNQEEFDDILEQFTDASGNLTIPLTEDEIAAMGITVDADGNITITPPQGGPTVTYNGGDAPAGFPRVNSGGQVASGYRGGARYEGGANRMDIDLDNLTPGVDGLVEMIYQAEANGDPDMIFGGSPIQPPRPLTEMTVREVRRFQDQMVAAGSASSACGACQVIRSTMDGAISSGLLDPNQLFNQEAQMTFTIGKLNERGLQRFINGDIDEMTFMRNVSMEWASFPRDMGGASYYAGDGLNHALVSPQQVLAQLRTIRES